MSDLEIESGELDDCPYCGSGKIDADSPDPDVGGRECRCEECGRSWTEGFVFTTIYIPEEYQKVYLERKFVLKSCTCEKDFNSYCPVHSPELNN